MGKLLEAFEGLFVIKRKEATYKRGLVALILALVAVAVIPGYFKYEDHIYAQYKEEYEAVAGLVASFKSENHRYPLGASMDWNEEKDLRIFFEENQLNKNRNLYYLDTALLKGLEQKKYTYIIDGDSGKLYTGEYVIYKFRRWHFAFY